jgi:AraC-like DNA-binding protein/ligand-binding sensor protein
MSSKARHTDTHLPGTRQGEGIPQGIQDIVEHYGNASGIPCMILDIGNGRLQGTTCELCSELNRSASQSIGEHCLHIHQHHAQLAERFGGAYIYFCTCSMLYWISPVLIEGVMKYAIVAGPVMVMEPDEALDDADLPDHLTHERARELLGQLVRVDIHRVHHLSEVLRMCAGWASGYTEHRMVESQQALQMQSKLSEFIQHMKQHPPEENAPERYYPIEKEQQLQDAIKWGDHKEAQRIMQELLGLLFLGDSLTAKHTHFRMMELVSLLSRAAIQGGAPVEEVMEVSARNQQEIGHYSSIEGISLWFSRILRTYTDLVYATKDAEYGVGLARALRYIRTHHDQRITLEQAAAAVSLSAPYLSRLFNERLHISFTTYINRLRVEHSERLLVQTRLPLVEIAGIVGFEDQSYFSKVFKRITGTTPGQYRNRGGRFPSETHEIHSASAEASQKP